MPSLPLFQSSLVRLESVTIFLLLQSLFTLSSASTCYRPNGVEGDSDIQACHNNLATGQHSACCNLGKGPPDLCLGGGLCYRQDGYDGNFLIYAVGCTDETGADAACQQYCPTGKGVAMYSLNACFDGRWCCNDLTTSESCCDASTGEGVFTMDHLLSLDPTPSATADNTAATVTVTTTAGNTAAVITVTTTVEGVTVTHPANALNTDAATTNCTSPDSTNSKCSRNKEGILVGASVGAAVGGFILAALISLFCMRRSFRREHDKQYTQGMHGGSDAAPAWIPSQNLEPRLRRHEMDAKNQVLAGVTPSPVEGMNTYLNEVPGSVAYEIDSTRRGY